MALASSVVTTDLVDQCERNNRSNEQPRMLIMKQLGYCAAIETAEHAVGNLERRVVLSNLRHCVQNFTDNPVVERSINNRKFYPVIEAFVGVDSAFERFGRSSFDRRRIIAVPTAQITDEVSLVALTLPPITNVTEHRVHRYETNASLGMVPLGAESALYGTSETTRQHCQIIGTNNKVRLKKKSAKSRAVERAAQDFGFDNDDTGDRRVPAISRKKRSRKSDDDDDDDEEEPPGISLMDTDGEDEDEDEEEDGEFDDFIAANDDEENEEEDEEEDEEESPQKKRQRVIIEDVSDDDFTGPNNQEVVVMQTLQDRNPVPAFDNRCVLYETGTITLKDGSQIEADHTYTVDGEIGYTSTTTDVGHYMEKFDDIGVALKMVRNKSKWPENREYYSECVDVATRRLRQECADDIRRNVRPEIATLFIDCTISFETFKCEIENATALRNIIEKFEKFEAEHIVEIWKRWRDLGTEMHECIEFFFEPAHPEITRDTLNRRVRINNDMAIAQFLRWHDEWLIPRGYEPFRMELRIFDKEMKLCGSVDALFRHRDTGEIIMVDWKRSRDVSRDGYTRVPLSEVNSGGCLFEWKKSSFGMPPWVKTCKGGVFDDLYDHKYTKYYIQQCVYRWLIETHTNIRISRHYLLVCHPKQGSRYDLMPLEYDQSRIEQYRVDRLRRLVMEEVNSLD